MARSSAPTTSTVQYSVRVESEGHKYITVTGVSGYSTVQRSNRDKLNNDKLMVLHTVRYSLQDMMNKA